MQRLPHNSCQTQFEISGPIREGLRGATLTHRVLADLFHKRGVKLEHTDQLNTEGNSDFLNMLNRNRLASKKESKTEAGRRDF